MATCGDNECEDRIPPPDVTRDLFLHWRDARRGCSHAEVMSNPVWSWLVRTRVSAYWANNHFDGPSSLGGNPGWCCDRMGQSETRLADGRTVLVAGEHEDYYDPDFYIYNDVIVRHPSGEVEIFGYPERDFVPTDFQSSTLLPDGTLLLIGNLGYVENRRPETTQIYRLDPTTMKIAAVKSTGKSPGWISKHQAERSGDRIVVCRGQVSAEFLGENIDDWELNLVDWKWSRLTERKWTRVDASRKDGRWNQLYRLWMFAYLDDDVPISPFMQQQLDEAAAELGYRPDPELVRNRYRPPIPHVVLPKDEDAPSLTDRIVVEGVVVRYEESVSEVRMTIEGELPKQMIEVLTEDLVDKLSRLEASPYEFRIY